MEPVRSIIRRQYGYPARRLLTLRPATRDEANRLVQSWHRHSGKVTGHRFALLALLNGEPVGAAIVARPVAQALQDDYSAEVVRLVTNGTPNACSFLYGACRRVWKEMGGERLYTYTLATEPGTSLRAAGFHLDAFLEERSGWDTPARPRPNSAERRPARIRWVSKLLEVNGGR